jgi:tetratricopeptide (TPR) repeat protein
MDAHEYLADYYFKNGNFLKAWKEYNSLTRINPYRGSYYRKTGDCLLKLNDLPEAYRFFARSTEYEESFYAHFRAGEICMIKNDFEGAIIHFQKSQAKANKEEKEKSLVKIYQSLHYLNRGDEGNEIAEYFKRISPNRPIAVPPKSNTFMEYIPMQVKGIVNEAQKSMNAGNNEKAIELLNQSLEIKETPVAYRLLGEIHYKNKEFEKAQYNLMKAFTEFKFDTPFLSTCFMAEVAANKLDLAKVTLEQLKRTNPKFPAIAQFQLILNNSNSGNITNNLPVNK